MNNSNDLNRLRHEYEDRKNRPEYDHLYSLDYAPYRFAVQNRQRDTLHLLQNEQVMPLEGKRILEIGCGRGGILLEYASFGAQPQALFGIDILHDRLVQAQQKLPLAGLYCADGQLLPFAGQCFDVVMQYTAFSSILDDSVKQRMAAEMLRVLQPDGTIIWYDFWLNPTNPQTRGIRPAEIRRLFPRTKINFSKITLAPPIARKIVNFSWAGGSILEAMKIFNTHYLALIRPEKVLQNKGAI